MAFPPGSKWYPDGYYADSKPLKETTDNVDNVIDNVYSMIEKSAEELKDTAVKYPNTIKVCDPSSEIPLFSCFVKYPMDEKNNGGYLSITPDQLDEALAQAKN